MAYSRDYFVRRHRWLKKIADICINGKSQQAFSAFLNSTKDKVFSRLYDMRLNVQLSLANKLKKRQYSFFIIDDYLFKKRKNKKTQGAGYNYCHDAKKARKSQCVVSSSCLINGFHIPFKHIFYVGKKYISKSKFRKKTDLALDLLCRFSKWALRKNVCPSICLIDGSYTNRKIIEFVLKQSAFKEFIGRFNKGRNIKTKDFEGRLGTYIKSLNITKDFKQYKIDEKEKLIHETKMSLDYAPEFKLIVILDDPTDINSARPLITNMLDLPAEIIAEYYALRWKEETFHQVVYR